MSREQYPGLAAWADAQYGKKKAEEAAKTAREWADENAKGAAAAQLPPMSRYHIAPAAPSSVGRP
jgi:hypothetical protein